MPPCCYAIDVAMIYVTRMCGRMPHFSPRERSARAARHDVALRRATHARSAHADADAAYRRRHSAPRCYAIDMLAIAAICRVFAS